MISAKVIADSKNEFGHRLTTMIVTFPRIILAENNTHRMISKNSASSRAIPYRKMVEKMFGESNLRFTPVAWQKDHSGMQGHEYFTDPEKIAKLNNIWDRAAYSALGHAEELSNEGVTKQLCNRLLEPFMWHTVIVTATEWTNFFHLRCPNYVFTSADGGKKASYRSRKDLLKIHTDSNMDYATDLQWRSINTGMAEIHMMDLAEAMWDAYNESTPKALVAGAWHIPFGDNIPIPTHLKNWEGLMVDYLNELSTYMVKVATARCARVSYTVVGEEAIKKGDKVSFKGKHVFTVKEYNKEGATLVEETDGVYPSEEIEKIYNYENDIKLHDRLAASGHWSPFEHCARAMNVKELDYSLRNEMVVFNGEEAELSSIGWSGNFRGFIQYRKMFENENVTK